MDTITLPVYNRLGKEVDTVKLNSSVFDGTINKPAIYQVVCGYLANQRRGLASTKTRGEVSGGGRKPWRQKGTGRARAGSTRSPLWRHGGVVFGPHPRSFSYNIPKKIKDLALKSGLNIKLKTNNLIVLDELKIETVKTKDAAGIFKNLNLSLGGKNKVLLLSEKIEKNARMALRNIGFLTIGVAQDTHAYEVMRHKKLIITKAGLSALIDRLK